MNARKKELEFLLGLAQKNFAEDREVLSAIIEDLRKEQGVILTEHTRALMLGMLREFIHDCDMAVRRKLERRLANVDYPENSLLNMLANDDKEVTELVLKRSAALRDGELIQIVRYRAQQHLLATAMRRSFSEYIMGAPENAKFADIIKTLLENPDPEISMATAEYLSDESRRLDTYQEPLIKQKDLKPELAKRIYLWVSVALRSHILENFNIYPSELDDQLEVSIDDISAYSILDCKNREAHQPAGLLARHLARRNMIMPELLIQALRQGEVRLFEAFFCELGGLMVPQLQRVIYQSGSEGLAIACRALEMPKHAFATIFLLSRRSQLDRRAIDSRELSHTLMFFDNMDPGIARDVVKGWRRDPNYQRVIEYFEEERSVG